MSKSVAIIGGGIAGTTAARLAQSLGLSVTLFDQGQRGVGGRMSHRRVDRASHVVLPNDDLGATDGPVDRFDHGCQFFFSSSPRFTETVQEWIAAGVVTAWQQRCVLWSTSTSSSSSRRDFFGALENQLSPCYVGKGGMHNIARYQARMAIASGATLLTATRVSSVQAAPDAGDRRWQVLGTSGFSALHNTPEVAAAGDAPKPLGMFDAVIFTDASSSQGKWHRASAGAAEIAPAMALWIASRPRLPLFTAMLVIPPGPWSAHDAIVFDSGPVWYACRNSAKPGFGGGIDEGKKASGEPIRESWTIVSTPEFACQEIAHVPMCDQAEGGVRIFKPQEDSYLNAPGVGPADVLARAFLDAVQGPSSTSTSPSPSPLPSPSPSPWLFLQGQRWGSAVPGSLNYDKAEVVEIAGTLYQRTTPNLSPREPLDVGGNDYLSDDAQRIYYCGDFVSRRAAGVEAAVLSAEDCVRHVAQVLLSS